MEHEAFVERVLQHLGTAPPTRFTFLSWPHGGRPTKEGFAIMPAPGLVPEKVIDAVMDVDNYTANLSHVEACRAVPDARYQPPEHVRFYQRLSIPVLGPLHHDSVLHRLGEHGGYQVAAWSILRAETDALSGREAVRSDYNHGAWLVAPAVIGYGLGSAPRRDDVGFLKWKALTKGADVAASSVLKSNLEAMAAWAARR
jgi:hypothetical protein